MFFLVPFNIMKDTRVAKVFNCVPVKSIQLHKRSPIKGYTQAWRNMLEYSVVQADSRVIMIKMMTIIWMIVMQMEDVIFVLP